MQKWLECVRQWNYMYLTIESVYSMTYCGQKSDLMHASRRSLRYHKL